MFRSLLVCPLPVSSLAIEDFSSAEMNMGVDQSFHLRSCMSPPSQTYVESAGHLLERSHQTNRHNPNRGYSKIDTESRFQITAYNLAGENKCTKRLVRCSQKYFQCRTYW